MFPTIYSTFDPSALAAFISTRYGLTHCQCELIQLGVGDTYLINAASGKFVARIYRNNHRTQEHIQAEVELLNILRSNRVSVSYPVADQNGQYIQTLEAAEGSRHAVLFSFAEGQSPIKLTEGQLKVLGHELAQFHHVSSKVKLTHTRWTFDISSTLIEPISRTRHLFRTMNNELTWWISAAAQAREYLESLDTKNFSAGYCHYDVLPKNFHFDGDQITLFDFDFFGSGWLINDLMSFWTHLRIDVQFNRMTQSEADRCFQILLDAYRDHRFVSSEELRAIPSLSIGWWCFYMGFHASHDQFMTFVKPDHLKMRTALIRQITERNSKWNEQFV